MKTNQNVVINDYKPSGARHGYGRIVIPKGTKLTHQTAMGIDKEYHFVEDLSWIKRDYPEYEHVLIHDFKYYNYNVPKEYVDYE